MTSARAQPVDGLYVGAGAGMDLLQNEFEKPYGPIGPNRRAYSFDPGSATFLSLGWGFAGRGVPVRLEVEGDYANSHIRTAKAAVALHAGGFEQQYGGFANVLYDIDPDRFGFSLPVFPYLGAGAGYQEVGLVGVNSDSVGFSVANHGGSETKGAFAYQAIAGLSLPVPVLPGLSLTAEYRLVGVITPPAYERGNGSGNTVFVNGVYQPPRATFSNIFNNDILVGLRYAFNTASPALPPAAPLPGPVVQPARSYLVFFDWDRASLTSRARQIIHEAADNSTRVQYTRIEVDGYTDTSGTPRYNQGLSIRRAEAVAAELVRDGVPRAAISIQGFGETHLLVPTGPGVREPQNRRVEIVIR